MLLMIVGSCDPKMGCHFRHVGNIPLLKASYDSLLAASVLLVVILIKEHRSNIPSTLSTIMECSRLLKPGESTIIKWGVLASWHYFLMKLLRKSMGKGKMMVEFFSAEIVLSV